MQVCPLIFEPIFKRKIWGGRRLEQLLRKPLPPDEPIGESWELADLEEDQSVVAAGPAAGKTLGELVRTWGNDLLGHVPLFEGRFPLLIKFLDAQEVLSVQVHPDETMARRLGGKVRVKNEAWYVVAAEPEGCIYRGFVPGTDEQALRQALAEGCVEQLLQRIPVRQGHCYYLPSGTVHALGAGVLVAEVQTPSDTTYRFYDWDRVDSATGQPRELHLEEALQCVSYDPNPPAGEERSHVGTVWTSVTRLVSCPSFVLERVRMSEGVEQEIPYHEPVIWMVLEGAGQILYNGNHEPVEFGVGDTVLLPAGLRDGRVRTTADCLWLEVSLPVPSMLAEQGLPATTTRQMSGSGSVHLRVQQTPPGG